jgi:cytochrome d ubiquinol oxidase subunit I
MVSGMPPIAAGSEPRKRLHMVGCGLIMLVLAWLGSYLIVKGRIAQSRFFLWLVFLSFPLPFIAILTGWYTAEVGRQPWVVYGVLRTADAVTPFLTAREAGVSLVVFCAIYTASCGPARPDI